MPQKIFLRNDVEGFLRRFHAARLADGRVQRPHATAQEMTSVPWHRAGQKSDSDMAALSC